ncbi:MAG: hypothetical protein ABI858_02750 [Pseudoxanthomonas sp.]
MDIATSLPTAAGSPKCVLQLHVIAARWMIKMTQVAAVHGDSGLSTWSVDKTVHETHAPRFSRLPASACTPLAKKTAKELNQIKSMTCP